MSPTHPPISPPDDTDEITALLSIRRCHCPNCAYELSGLRGATCPECGAGLRLCIRQADTTARTYLSGIIALSIGAGFSGILLLLLLIFHFGAGFSALSAGTVAAAIGGTVVFGTLLWLWVAGQAHVPSDKLRRRSDLAFGCWVLAVAYLVLFGIFCDIS